MCFASSGLAGPVSPSRRSERVKLCAFAWKWYRVKGTSPCMAREHLPLVTEARFVQCYCRINLPYSGQNIYRPTVALWGEIGIQMRHLPDLWIHTMPNKIRSQHILMQIIAPVASHPSVKPSIERLYFIHANEIFLYIIIRNLTHLVSGLVSFHKFTYTNAILI